MTFDHNGIGFATAGAAIHDGKRVCLRWGKLWEADEDTPEEEIVGTSLHGSVAGQAVQVRRKD